MKITKSISAFILLAIMPGYGGGNKQLTDDFITVDVTANYQNKN